MREFSNLTPVDKSWVDRGIFLRQLSKWNIFLNLLFINTKHGSTLSSEEAKIIQYMFFNSASSCTTQIWKLICFDWFPPWSSISQSQKTISERFLLKSTGGTKMERDSLHSVIQLDINHHYGSRIHYCTFSPEHSSVDHVTAGFIIYRSIKFGFP